ncbi:MAG TPA: serine/threonine-protein kinase [Kofleriaceae bacterium]|nr:serine/threonine-protein kinase [Kofleriaceae bacterium]
MSAAMNPAATPAAGPAPVPRVTRVAISDRYWLLRPLATGGMAEIYLARQGAMAGFDKQIVIKRLKPELARDPRVVEMFLDEARIGAQLNHPNVVHVYDVDEHEGVPYIAMEYIVGEELVQLCRRGLGLGRFLPLEHAVELIRQAAAGLGYVHAKQGAARDAHTGQPLDIVHCDISPTNLLVTQDGFLKIIDFGIARARGQRPRDEAALPGKLSYMSPEQAGRRPLDRRSDIFSLGVVLYEITVGRRLFKGPAQEVVQRLQTGTIAPPTFVDREFPPQLEAIIMRALERHPDNRYQSAYDLSDDLEEFLRASGRHSGPVRIARYLDELELAAGGARRPELISEQELARAHEDLELDRQLFDGYHPAEAEAPSEWDEFDETDAAVARALGIEPAQLRVARTRTPVASHDAPLMAAPDDTSPQDRIDPALAAAVRAGEAAEAGDGDGAGGDGDGEAAEAGDATDEAVEVLDEADEDQGHAVGDGAIVGEGLDPRLDDGAAHSEVLAASMHGGVAGAGPAMPVALQPMPMAGPPARPTLAQAMPWLVLCTCAGVAIGLLCGLLL